MPILKEFRKYKPSVISLAMDPEGSGPDTHYKVLQAIAGAVSEWDKEEDLSQLRIIGYRNVWFRHNPWDVEVIVPVSMNSLAVLDKSFTDCYLSQVNASFPSYQLDGKFSELKYPPDSDKTPPAGDVATRALRPRPSRGAAAAAPGGRARQSRGAG